MINRWKFPASGFAATILCVLLSCRVAYADGTTLHAYGPGGPLVAMKECAERFGRLTGITIEVTSGPEAGWIARAKTDADLFYEGAEYMLTDFIQRNPGLLDEQTRISLYDRAAGILVRKGNPKGIKTIEDLAKEGVRLLDVNGAGQFALWEDLAGGKGLIPAIRRNIAISTGNTAQAIDKWKTVPELDAWITFESWHFRLKEETDLVRLPESERLYRGTPVAVAAASPNREQALRFLEFLKSGEAHAIFRKWGWR